MKLDNQALTVAMPATGEHFLFRNSFRSEEKLFRFTWTLGPGKTGPGEHFHEYETESFKVLEGALTIWIEGKRVDYGPGMSVSIPPRKRHRFKNFGKQPVVVEVTLDGPRMEDLFIPLAVMTRDSGRSPALTLGMTGQVFVQADEHQSSTPASAIGRAIMTGLAGVARLLGSKPLPPVYDWSVPASEKGVSAAM